MRITSKLFLASVLALLAATAQRAAAQGDVTQPGDPIFASSSNSPGSEGVANAIDNTQAKYLNFDTRNPNNPPSGFAVSPSVGVTRVVGMTVQSANDAPERDPKRVRLEGSNDAEITGYNTGTWTVITELELPAYTARFQRQTVFFDNFKAYRHYRWTVLEVATPNGCCMQVADVELLGSTLPQDVTQPGDAIIASSSNSPGSEGVANAIDNTQAKYLNFDTRNPNNPPSGFVVTPSIGRTVVSGMTIQSANDAPERDPKLVRLEGSNDDAVTGFNAGTWTIITEFETETFTARFQRQTFLFDNFAPYKHYRWTVLSVATPNGCCMQVAEVELLGTGAPQDVTQPGDRIIASSSNSPGSEGVANAIDNTQAKYLNFDTRNPNNPPSGFVVTPSIGATVVTGMSIQAANDAPERDPKNVRLEGSNDDTIADFNSGTWTVITEVVVPDFTARFQKQEIFFKNNQSFKHYRWTVTAVATPNGCCMQVAEVELLAVTASNPCNLVQFTESPIDTPALVGSPATFFAKVNGPWAVQWLKDGVPIPGATSLSYSTAPLTAAGDPSLYSLAIVGCQTSQVVRASVFTPSATKSIGISFIGGGANGAPTSMLPEDIAGVQPQAYWINASGGSGATGDQTSLPDALNDSDNQPSTITFEFQTGGTWGAGTGTDTPTTRMLNGLVGTQQVGQPGTFTFRNVPAGSHSILIYAVSPPLQFQEVSMSVTTGTPASTIYLRTMNSDEYKPAPGFYRATSTQRSNPTVSDFVRFDGIQAVGGEITISVETLTPGVDRQTGVNGIQLVLNAPNPGAPPAITTDPQPTVAAAGGTASLSVVATGNNLTYSWRKNGRSLPNGGNISGADTANLTIRNFGDADVGIYSVAVFNPAGSVVSRNASVRLSKFDITDQLVGHWRFDASSGTTVANSIASGQAGTVTGTPGWGTGKIGNGFTFDGATYIFVPNYTKATKGISGSAWVNAAATAGSDQVIFQNAQPTLTISGGAGRIIGQFQLVLQLDPVDFTTVRPMAAVGIGPNVARVVGSAPWPGSGWNHVAFSADGAQIRLYVNGQQVGVTDYLADINPPDVPYISMGVALNLLDPADPASGLFPDQTAANVLVGGVDDIGLWTRALTADEISKIYAAGQAGQALNTVVVTPPAGEPEITGVTLAGGNITVQWTGGGTLFSAPAVTGPYTTTGDSDGSFSEAASGTAKFYRVQR